MKYINKEIKLNYESVPADWNTSCVYTESTLHQISPYIGKLKSSIARELILKYSEPGELVVDPFSGSGTIPAEAVFQNRKTFAVDISSYARILTNAKLFPPGTLQEALNDADRLLNRIKSIPDPDLRKIPQWVRKFFHPRTLKEIIKVVDLCISYNDDFLLACILGILHHQRIGFLSYPSSHLVPYLRNKKFPKEQFPELYLYRALRPRLLAKIHRVFSRLENQPNKIKASFKQGKIENVNLPTEFNCLITSPPYMNALDYNRDNRLRLWFITRNYDPNNDNQLTGSKENFEKSITSLAKKMEKSLKIKGYSIFIVGERVKRSYDEHPSKIVQDIISVYAPSLKLVKIMIDKIPDIRRSRRNCKGIKSEHFLIYQKVKNA